MIQASSELQPILQTRGLEKRYGGVKALAGVDFTLMEGELRCLIGPNGAGKSTFFKMVSGQIPASSGEITICGTPVQRPEAHEVAALGVGIKNQVPDIMNGLTVRENLWLAASNRLPVKKVARAVEQIAEKVGIGGILERLAGELAHGQRQWVEIAMVIVCGPRIVLLDEPAAGMSDEETERTANLIREINRDTTIVVVEHDMAFIRAIAQQVTVFHQGRILMEGDFPTVVKDPVVRDVYLGRGGSDHA